MIDSLDRMILLFDLCFLFSCSFTFFSSGWPLKYTESIANVDSNMPCGALLAGNTNKLVTVKVNNKHGFLLTSDVTFH